VLINPFSQLDVYLATYPDRMHHLDLGLFNYQVIYTREMLKNLCGQVAVDELDKRLAAIPSFLASRYLKMAWKILSALLLMSTAI